jgi:inositol-phosphate transport system ATP-binding protein
MSMCDRIALMREGRIEQLDTPAAMYDRPANRFVAGFLGNPPISFVPAVAGEELSLANGNRLPAPRLAARGDITLGIRPEHFGPQHGTGLKGRITFVEPQGREDLFDVTLTGGEQLRAILPAGSGHGPGDTVDWGVASGQILAFSPNGDRL